MRQNGTTQQDPRWHAPKITPDRDQISEEDVLKGKNLIGLHFTTLWMKFDIFMTQKGMFVFFL